MSPVVGLPPAAVAPAHAAAHVRAASSARYGWQAYTVRPGDTLSDLALRTHTTVGALVHRNRLGSSNHLLVVGSRLQVPRTHPVRRHPRRAAPRVATYRVRYGDTLDAIAARHRVSVATLLRLNRLDASGHIYAGALIRLPASAVRAAVRRAAASAVSITQVRVRPGDTVGAIALRYHVSQAAIVKANRLPNPGMVRIGAVLKVPVRRGSRPAFSSNTFAGRTYSNAIVHAAAVNRAYLASHRVPTRLETRAIIVEAARRHGVDPRLALAVAWQESGWNQREVSVANAIGTMQVIPSSGQWASVMAGRRLNLLSTRDNVTAGVVILRSLTRSAHSTEQAVAGYYQGLGSVQQYGMYPDTKAYVRSIMAHRARM